MLFRPSTKKEKNQFALEKIANIKDKVNVKIGEKFQEDSEKKKNKKSRCT